MLICALANPSDALYIHPVQTLGDLPYTFELLASCPTCRRVVPLDVRKLIDRYGPKADIESIRARLRCTECGQRGRKISLVYNSGRS